MSVFVSGLLAGGYVVIVLFFLRFWRDTRDRLFGWFAVAFALLAVQRVVLLFTLDRPALEAPVYGVRLLAFLIIIAAVLDKNRAARRDRG